MPRTSPLDHFNALPPDHRRRTAPAVARNRDAILDVLRPRLPLPGRVLEVASGTGEHGAYFCAHLADLEWQPTDVDAQNLSSIGAWKESVPLPNLLPPMPLDVLAPLDGHSLLATQFDAGFCANLIHIAPWEVCEGLMDLMGRALKAEAPFVLYGPFRVNGVHTAPSNAQFEQWLHSLNPAYGVRDMAEVTTEANLRHLQLTETIAMPANNFCLVFRKCDTLQDNANL